MSDVVNRIKGTAKVIYEDVKKKKRPSISTPVRSLSNVTYDERSGYFAIGKVEKTRTLTASTVKTFAQTLRMMDLSKQLVETDDIATKREAYYVSKNWGEARFKE